MGLWFDKLTTNGKRAYVRPELVEGLFSAEPAKTCASTRLIDSVGLHGYRSLVTTPEGSRPDYHER